MLDYIETLYDEDTGVVTTFIQLGEVEVVGSSKCMSEDEFDKTLGENLALGRAFIKLGKTLQKNAFDEVHKRDRARRHREEKAAEAAERHREALYQWECDFAELINLQLENDIIPEQVKKGKHKKSKMKKPRGKAFQIRKDLPT